MRYAILSDIHANPSAMALALADARQHDAESIVCLGDVVGYGPDPVEAVALCRSSCDVTLMGNHDAAVAGVIRTDNFIPFAKKGVKRHAAELDEEDKAWLRGLRYLYKDADFACVHGTPFKPECFFYMHDPQQVMLTLEYLINEGIHLIFVGHTHHACSYMMASSGHFKIDGPKVDLTLAPDDLYIVNAGSVGYPRADHDITYVLYDSEARTVKFRHLPFDFKAYAESLTAKDIALPLWLSDLL